jgi:hypothetical protein
MAEELIPIVLFITFFGSIAFITRVISDNRVKRELVSMKADKDTIDYLLLQAPVQQHESSLKWGIVTVALGLAFALIHVLDFDGNDPMTYAIMFIFGGGGLLGHYVLKAGTDEKV